jgi:hypothetical protein
LQIERRVLIEVLKISRCKIEIEPLEEENDFVLENTHRLIEELSVNHKPAKCGLVVMVVVGEKRGSGGGSNEEQLWETLETGIFQPRKPVLLLEIMCNGHDGDDNLAVKSTL